MEFSRCVVVLAVVVCILSLIPAIDVEHHRKVHTTPVALEESVKCSRVEVPGFSPLKRYADAHIAALVVVPPPQIEENSYKKIRICLHNNASLGLCECEKDKWERIEKGMWGANLDSYEDRYVDIKFIGDLSASITISIQEIQRWSVQSLFTHLAPWELPPVVSYLWVTIHVRSSMAIATCLAIFLIFLFQTSRYM